MTYREKHDYYSDEIERLTTKLEKCKKRYEVLIKDLHDSVGDHHPVYTSIEKEDEMISDIRKENQRIQAINHEIACCITGLNRLITLKRTERGTI